MQGLEPLSQELQNFYGNNADDGEGIYLLAADKPVAAGVVNYEEPASMDPYRRLARVPQAGLGKAFAPSAYVARQTARSGL